MKNINQHLNIISKRKTNEKTAETLTVFSFLRAAIKAYFNIIAKGSTTSSIDWNRKI